MDSEITEDICSPADLERTLILEKICGFILSDIKEKILGKDLYLSFDEQSLKWCIRGSDDELIIATEDLYQAVAYFTYIEESKEDKNFSTSDFITTVVGNWTRYARKKDGRLSGSLNST